MINNPYLIFDFDGTLIDSFHIVIEKFNLLANEFAFRKITDSNQINMLRDLTSTELIKYLKIPIYRIPNILRCVRKYMQNEMKLLPPVINLPEVLKKRFCRKKSVFDVFYRQQK